MVRHERVSNSTVTVTVVVTVTVTVTVSCPHISLRRVTHGRVVFSSFFFVFLGVQTQVTVTVAVTVGASFCVCPFLLPEVAE
jgi:hypothetical protein